MSARAEVDLWLLCRSLWECGAGVIADGRLLDLIRRLYCFGTTLMKIDIRQEASKHTLALDEITTYLEMGSYAEWDESERLKFLVSSRPVFYLHVIIIVSKMDSFYPRTESKTDNPYPGGYWQPALELMVTLIRMSLYLYLTGGIRCHDCFWIIS